MTTGMIGVHYRITHISFTQSLDYTCWREVPSSTSTYLFSGHNQRIHQRGPTLRTIVGYISNCDRNNGYRYCNQATEAVSGMNYSPEEERIHHTHTGETKDFGCD